MKQKKKECKNTWILFFFKKVEHANINHFKKIKQINPSNLLISLKYGTSVREAKTKEGISK